MGDISRFSAYLYGWGATPPTLDSLSDVVKQLDRLGFYSAGFPYHMTLPHAPMFDQFSSHHLFDPLALLPSLFAVTNNLRLGIHSLILPLLPPYFWAKNLSTIDVISGGRLIPGMCMGWSPGDFKMAGVEEHHKRRARVTDEQMEVITRLWTEDGVNHDGKYYRLSGVTLDPKPVQKPYPPIWYGGGIPSIPRAARYATHILPAPMPVEEIREQWMPAIEEENQRTGSSLKISLMNFVAIVDDESKVESEVVPRLRECIRLTATGVKPEDMTIVGSPETCAARVRGFLDAGVDHLLLDFSYRGSASAEYAREQIERFAEEVVPLV